MSELTAALSTLEKAREVTNCPADVDLQDHLKQLVAENLAFKSNLMFWDADNPELPYESPEEIASECELNYNDELVVQVAGRLPNRTYRVSECWESDVKLELVGGNDLITPATDSILREAEARGVEKFGETTIKIGEEEGDEDIVYAGKQALLFAKQLREVKA